MATGAQHLGHQAAEAKTASHTTCVNRHARKGVVHGEGTVHGDKSEHDASSCKTVTLSRTNVLKMQRADIECLHSQVNSL